MEVFLVPVGADAHELYCEVPDLQPDAGGERPTGVIRALRHRFQEMIAAAERDRRARMSGADVEEPAGWWARLKGRTLRWAAETIAEQRLLWQLRRCARAALVYPADVTESAARTLLRGHLARDYDKHRRWLMLDTLAFVGSGVFMLVPGPNVIAYYFAFRLVGHFLSMRGARQGLDVTEWRLCPSDDLRDVRGLVAADAEARDARLRAIEARLGLQHFAAFVRRVVYSGR